MDHFRAYLSLHYLLLILVLRDQGFVKSAVVYSITIREGPATAPLD